MSETQTLKEEAKLLTKTLTFGLGNPMAFKSSGNGLVELTEDQRKAIYNGLRDASTVVARIINLLNCREYIRRIMKVPEELVDQFKPNYSLLKGPLKRLGIEEVEQVAGSVLKIGRASCRERV